LLTCKTIKYAWIRTHFSKCDNSTFPIREEWDPQFGKPRLRDWHNKISYQLPQDSYVYFFPCSAVLWHAWVGRLHAGCKESPVSVTSAGSRAQPHSLRPGIKLSYTRTVNRSSKWEQSSVMKGPSTAPRFQRILPTRQANPSLPAQFTLHKNTVDGHKKLFIHSSKF